MGSVFAPPRPPAPTAVTYTPSPASSTTASEPTPSAENESAIRDIFARRNRGIGGTVLTSWQGALATNDLRPRRNNLLGE